MIEPLIRIRSHAAALRDANIDTDIIFPARFLLRIDREGMEDCLFRDRRFDSEGRENPEFPLNREPFRAAQVLVVGPGFGCGSSREQAVWALVDYGIRAVIGTDFGDIFAGNAAKNGLLLVRLGTEQRDALSARAEEGAIFEIDVPDRRLAVAGEDICRLDIGDDQAQALTNGWDEMDMILNREMDHVARFEDQHRRRQPWLFQEN